ncbi:MAG: phage shock protein C [Planctomycetota bacterium]|jgi:phage shock protein C
MNEPVKSLRRSHNNRQLAGVLGGFAERFDLDPTGLRIGFVLLSLLSAGFPGILVYVVCWLVIPEDGPVD